MILLFGTFLTLLASAVEVPNSSHTLVVQQVVNFINGHVSDERRTPIPDLQVELLNDVDSVIRRTKTDSPGLFMFQRLTTGIFQVRVQTYGTSYIGQTKRVQLERTRAFEQVDFVLATKQVPSTAATAGVVFVQEVPDAARKQYERGSTLLQKAEQRTEGLEMLKKAIEIFPLYFNALELLGTEYVKQQEYEPAIPVLTKAIEINGRAYQSLYALSVAQHNLQLSPQALESMRRAITLNQKSANANLWLGMNCCYSRVEQDIELQVS